jgi:L-seryl-tRNA(Ser) seleniumtransferase
VIGTAKYIEWVRLQGKGIGRAMKIGKDNILGFTQALEDRLQNGSESGGTILNSFGFESFNFIKLFNKRQ